MLWQVLIMQSYISCSFHSQMNQTPNALQDIVQHSWAVLHIAVFAAAPGHTKRCGCNVQTETFIFDS